MVGDSDLERGLSGIVGEVGDEVGGEPSSAIVEAFDRDVGIFSASGVVRVSVLVNILVPEDENVLRFRVGDSFESGEGHVSNSGKGERSGDGDESGGEAVKAHRAGGVDGVSLDESLGSALGSERDRRLSGPVGVSRFRGFWRVGDWCRVIGILGKLEFSIRQCYSFIINRLSLV